LAHYEILRGVPARNVASAYCDNVNARGVAEVEGGVAVLKRYLVRKSKGLLGSEQAPGLTPEQAYDKHSAGASGRAEKKREKK
jgi:hypothetical protein